MFILPYDPLLFHPNLLPHPKDSSSYFYALCPDVELSFRISEESCDVCVFCVCQANFCTQERDSKAHYICLCSYLKALHGDTLVLSPGSSKFAIRQHNQS